MLRIQRPLIGRKTPSRRRHMRRLKVLLFCTSLILALAPTRTPASPTPELVETFSFEDGLDGWVPNGIDLRLGAGTVIWSVIQSQTIAYDGVSSVQFYLANYND